MTTSVQQIKFNERAKKRFKEALKKGEIIEVSSRKNDIEYPGWLIMCNQTPSMVDLLFPLCRMRIKLSSKLNNITKL